MHSTRSGFLKKAQTWINSSLFNTDRAGEYFEYLLEGVDPMWSAIECKARILDVIQETSDTKTHETIRECVGKTHHISSPGLCLC